MRGEPPGFESAGPHRDPRCGARSAIVGTACTHPPSGPPPTGEAPSPPTPQSRTLMVCSNPPDADARSQPPSGGGGESFDDTGSVFSAYAGATAPAAPARTTRSRSRPSPRPWAISNGIARSTSDAATPRLDGTCLGGPPQLPRGSTGLEEGGRAPALTGASLASRKLRRMRSGRCHTLGRTGASHPAGTDASDRDAVTLRGAGHNGARSQCSTWNTAWPARLASSGPARRTIASATPAPSRSTPSIRPTTGPWPSAPLPAVVGHQTRTLLRTATGATSRRTTPPMPISNALLVGRNALVLRRNIERPRRGESCQSAVHDPYAHATGRHCNSGQARQRM
jgi:hypothetical protein